MDGIQMEPIGKYKADRNGSAKAAAWRNMVDQDLDDVAFLADSEKAREARDRSAPIATCSQRRAICLTAAVFSTLFAIALIVVYASPTPDCPCLGDGSLLPGQTPTDPDSTAAAAKDRIATNGAVFPWRGARLPTFLIPKHYSLWLHPNLTTGELRGEVSIDFKVDRDTLFIVLNVRDMNVTERALFKSGGTTTGPKIAKTLDYPPADQTYIEFKDKLRRKYNYTLSLRFITKLDRSDKQRGFFLAGHHRQRCAVSRFWLTHARSAFPCLDEPHFRATFKLTIVRDRFHVSLTNMPIVATEEAGFYLGHRLLQDEFATTPPMSPHMMALAVCRLQRRAAPMLPEADTNAPEAITKIPEVVTKAHEVTTTIPKTSEGSTVMPEDDEVLPPPEISLYSDQQVILDESEHFLDWVQKTIQQFAFELNTSYPLPKLDIVVVDGGSPYSEGWGLITLSPSTLSDTKTIARLLAQQWFGGLVSPRWWSSQWLMEALSSVLGERGAGRGPDALLLEHVLPALRLDSSTSVRAVASQRLERADIESATDELSLHKGAAIVSMAIEAAGDSAGRAALSRLLKEHRFASADARDLWRSLQKPDGAPPHAWDNWCERPGYPLLTATPRGPDVLLTQERFVMSAEPPEPEPLFASDLLTFDLRADLEDLFYEPENLTDTEEDINATSTIPPPTTRKPTPKTTKPPPPPKWVIPVTFTVGPLHPEYKHQLENITRLNKNVTESILHSGTWYEVANENTTVNGSRWAQNVTHLVWMNVTEMLIPDLGKHKWVRYNVGARGLYRVAPQDTGSGDTLAQYSGDTAAERALSLDDALVLSRAGRLPASRAQAAIARLSSERHWAPWRVVLGHLSWWRELLRLTRAGPPFRRLLRGLHPKVTIYSHAELDRTEEQQTWLSGALLTAGVEWENPVVTKQAVQLFDDWLQRNISIPEIYQEGAFTAGVRAYGEPAWLACWRALTASYGARALYRRRALVAALSSPADDWLFYRFAWTTLSTESQRNREWRIWATELCAAACRWRGAAAVWRILKAHSSLPLAALTAAARCLHQPQDYYQLKELLAGTRGLNTLLDMVALNVAWTSQAEADLTAYFNRNTTN